MGDIRQVLFTHDDLDGAGCRVLFELANRSTNDWKVYNCSNSNLDETVTRSLESGELSKNCVIMFGDICPGREVLQKVKDFTDRLHIYDHHRTNFWVTHEWPEARIIPENELGTMQSGTSIMYQAFCEMATIVSDAPSVFKSGYHNASLLWKFVDTVRAYDTFEFKQTGNMEAKRLQVLFQLLGMENFCKRYITLINGEISNTLINDHDMEFVSAKINAEQERIDTFGLADIIDCNVRGHRTAFVLGTFGMNFSELAYQFLNKFKQYDIFAGFSFADGGVFSFRTIKEDLDLGSEIAAPIGGGGHPPAAGAPICDELRDIFVDYLISEMNGEAYHFHY